MPQISKAGREAISQIGNWYLLRYFIYIRITNILSSPNILPKYVPDRILLKKYVFQNFEVGITAGLIKRKVKGWPERNWKAIYILSG